MRYLEVAAFVARCPPNCVPKTDDGRTATARIEAILDDASATCRSYVTRLTDAAGAAIAPAMLPASLAGSLAGIVYRIARHELYDGVAGDEEQIRRAYRAAIAELKELEDDPAPPDDPEAEIFDGSNDWLEGLPATTAAGETPGGDMGLTREQVLELINETLGSRLRTRRVELTLNADQIAALPTTRQQLLAAPESGVLVGFRIIVIKRGGPAEPPSSPNHNLWVAAAPPSGGMVTSGLGSPDWLALFPLYYNLAPSGTLFRPGDHNTVRLIGATGGVSLGFFHGGGSEVSAWSASPISLLAGGTSPATWAAATAGLGDLSLRFILEYEVLTD